MSINRLRILTSLMLIAMIFLATTRTIDAHHAVLRFNLEEMTATADRIFVGRCTAVEEGEEMIAQGQMSVTHYTFEVERALKGKLPQQITFTQLGHPAHRAMGKGRETTEHGRAVRADTFIHGMSEHHPGDRELLFLIPNYLGGKVTYPVGLYQGTFLVSRMPSGQDLVRNSINNLGLLTAPYNGTSMFAKDARIIFPERDNPIEEQAGGVRSQALAGKRGSLPLNDLLDLVDRINIAHGAERGSIVRSGRPGEIR